MSTQMIVRMVWTGMLEHGINDCQIRSMELVCWTATAADIQKGPLPQRCTKLQRKPEAEVVVNPRVSLALWRRR